MSTDPGPGGPRETSPERQTEEEEQRAPGHGRPDDVREDVGLDSEREEGPRGAPDARGA